MSELLKLFPECELITDHGLQQKVLSCWEDGLASGGWNTDDLKVIPFTLLIPNCRISLLTHVLAVTRTALSCARVLSQFYSEKYQLNLNHLTAGALLHDVGKLLEYKRQDNQIIKSPAGKLLRHPFSGAGMAIRHGLPDEVVHIIATHAKEGDDTYRSPESIIVHHADFMNFEPLKNL